MTTPCECNAEGHCKPCQDRQRDERWNKSLTLPGLPDCCSRAVRAAAGDWRDDEEAARTVAEHDDAGQLRFTLDIAKRALEIAREEHECTKCSLEEERRLGKYHTKARVYGTIAAHYSRALKEIINSGDGTSIALAALKWRHSDQGGVPIVAVEETERLLIADRRATAAESALATLRGEVSSSRADRESLGILVRETWVDWAREQPNSKPHHLLPWDEISEGDREVDRRIGEAVAACALRGEGGSVPECFREWQELPADVRLHVLCSGSYDELARDDRKRAEAIGERCLAEIASSDGAVIEASCQTDKATLIQHGDRAAKDQWPSDPFRRAYERATVTVAQPEPESGHGCPGDCMMCSGEACNKCGAGCWNNGDPHCDHDVLERHEEPEPEKPSPAAGEGELALAVREAKEWCQDPDDMDGIPHVCALLDAYPGLVAEVDRLREQRSHTERKVGGNGGLVEQLNEASAEVERLRGDVRALLKVAAEVWDVGRENYDDRLATVWRNLPKSLKRRARETKP